MPYPARDRLDRYIQAGDMLEVGQAPACRVFLHRGEFCFVWRGRIERARDYFSNSIEIVERADEHL